jgi:dihydrolipoamide dehydrogenase
MSNLYDLIVIGGGPGGYHAAHLGAKAGLNTLIIEKASLGGVCLNEGCIPSKAFLNSAKIYKQSKNSASFGVTSENVSYNHQQVVARKNEVVTTLVSGVAHTLKTAKAKVVKGIARIDGKQDGHIKVIVDDNTYLAKRLIIASGSKPVVPNIEGLKEALASRKVMTSKEILDIDHIPKTLTVIGGGIIGIEMASYFQQVGSKVTVVDMMPSIAGSIDQSVSKTLLNILKRQGIEFILSAKVTKINKESITYQQNGVEHHLTHDQALLAIGRVPNIENLGIESISIEVTKQKAIITDKQLKTNVANVYAIGDVNGKAMLAHTAYKEAEVAINTILSKKDEIDYDKIPWVIYTSPEVGSVGYTEEEAKDKGFDVKTVTLPIGYSGRHLSESDEKDGFLKLVIDQNKKTLLGAHMLSLYASEIILFLTSMIHLEIHIEEIKRIIYPHPTVGELIKDALFQF